jgi:hypothetical protein
MHATVNTERVLCTSVHKACNDSPEKERCETLFSFFADIACPSMLAEQWNAKDAIARNPNQALAGGG